MTDKINEMEEMEDDVIVFADDNGNEIEFIEVASFQYEEEWFVALQPTESTDEWSEDEVMFCKVAEDEEEGYEEFIPVEDEALNDKLLETLNSLSDEE
ncbi:MAG: DUF1292 domain-containing protein [Bacillota bacterium]